MGKGGSHGIKRRGEQERTENETETERERHREHPDVRAFNPELNPNCHCCLFTMREGRGWGQGWRVGATGFPIQIWARHRHQDTKAPHMQKQQESRSWVVWEESGPDRILPLHSRFQTISCSADGCNKRLHSVYWGRRPSSLDPCPQWLQD